MVALCWNLFMHWTCSTLMFRKVSSLYSSLVETEVSPKQLVLVHLSSVAWVNFCVGPKRSFIGLLCWWCNLVDGLYRCQTHNIIDVPRGTWHDGAIHHCRRNMQNTQRPVEGHSTRKSSNSVRIPLRHGRLKTMISCPTVVIDMRVKAIPCYSLLLIPSLNHVILLLYSTCLEQSTV
jgi:hypothetical protein